MKENRSYQLASTIKQKMWRDFLIQEGMKVYSRKIPYCGGNKDV